MRKFAFLFALLIVNPLYAQDRILVLHIASVHRQSGYNGFNPGIGLRLPYPGYSLGFGAYRNSLERTTAYAGAEKSIAQIGPARLRLAAGLVTGYEKSIAPFVLPEIAIGNGAAAVVFTYIPAVEFGDLKTVAAIGVSIETSIR